MNVSEDWTLGQTPLAPDPDVRLYHYTSLDGLLGILDSKALWATNARYLNDSQEVTYASRVFMGELINLEELLRSRIPADSDGQSVDSSRLGLAGLSVDRLQAYNDNSAGEPRQVFITSFCADGDLLSQWRGYASGNGVALALNPTALEAIEPNPGLTGDPGSYYSSIKPELKLRPVIYGFDDDQALSRLMDDAVPPGFFTTRGPQEGFYRPLSAVAAIKYPAFSEEQEHRLIFVRNDDHENSPNLKFRVHPTLGLVPYIALPFAHPARIEPPPDVDVSKMTALSAVVQGVVIGPGGDRKLRENAVRDLLNSYGLRKVPIWLSSAPFRT